MKKLNVLRTTMILLLVIASGAIFNSCVYNEDSPFESEDQAYIKTIRYTIHPYNWVRDGNNIWYHKLKDSWINWDIVDYGAVLVYMEAANQNDSWLLLPTTMYYEENGIQYVQEFQAWHSHQTIEIQYVDSHPIEPLLLDYDLRIKAIIIGDYYSTWDQLKGVDLKSYDAVARALNIDEDKTRVIDEEIKLD
jgi:hypothetical protein